MQIASRLTLTSLALGIAGVLAMGQADASGFQIRENSVRNMGRANAGTTVAWGDASVVLNNPAAMVNIKETTVQADITMIDLTADFEGSGTTALGPAAGPLTGGDGGDPGDATPVPAMAAVFPISDQLVLGASVSAPFGLKTEYDADWMGRYDAITSDVKVVDLTVSAAYAMTDRLSLGLGVIFQNSEVTLSKAIDFGTAICAGSGNPMNCFNPAYPFRPQQNDGMIEVAGDDTATGWVAGLQFKASDAVTLGYAHRSEISHDLEGTVDFTMPASVAAVLGANPAYADGNIAAAFDTPSTDTVSLRVDVNEDFRILADAQLTGWSSLQSVDIYRDNGAVVGAEAFEWDDTWFYSVGGEFDLSEALTLRAGVGFDETPTNDEHRTPRLPDNDRTVYTFGLTWQASPHMTIDASYMRVQIDTPTVNTTSSSGSHLVGEFDGYANLVGVSAQYRF